MIKKKIFIFGENGFIGNFLKNNLKTKKNIKLVSIKNINKNLKNVDSHYQNFWTEVVEQSETIIYLSFNNDLSNLKENLENSFIQNLLPLYILNNIIYKKQKKIKLIYLSTATLYANNAKLPVKENSPIKINNIYEYLKFLSEQILINSNNSYLNYQILRLSNVYGENKSKYIQKNRQVISKVIENAFKEKEIKIFGSGNYYRDFIHVKDVSEAIFRVICKNNIKNEVYNIGSGKKNKLIDIFKIIKVLINKKYKIPIKFKKIKLEKIKNNSDTRNFQASIIKSKKKLNWKPKVNFLFGLKNLVSYIHEKKN